MNSELALRSNYHNSSTYDENHLNEENQFETDDFTDGIQELDSFIDLSDRSLREIPPISGYITHLRLDSNFLRSAHKLKLDDFTVLTVLDLSYNQLEEFSTIFTQLTGLKELYLSHNNINNLPSYIGDLIHLEILDISYNSLERISPIGLSKLVNLHHLDLRHNKLIELPYSLGTLESRLYTLLLDNNPYGKYFYELVSPLLSDLQDSEVPAHLTKPGTRWEKLRSAMRKSISMDTAETFKKRSWANNDSNQIQTKELPRLRSRSSLKPKELEAEEAKLGEKMKKLSLNSTKEESGAITSGSNPPRVPAKNPRRFVKSSNGLSDGVMERHAFDNRRCQTLDGFVFIADSEPQSPSSNGEDGEPFPRTPTSLKRLGFSHLMDHEPHMSPNLGQNRSVTTRRRAPSQVSIHTTSSGSSSHSSFLPNSTTMDKSNQFPAQEPSREGIHDIHRFVGRSLPPLPSSPEVPPKDHEPGIRTNNELGLINHGHELPSPQSSIAPSQISLGEQWPPMPAGAHRLPSHSKLVDFFRQLRDLWDLSHQSSEAIEVAKHRRKVKDLTSRVTGESDRHGSHGSRPTSVVEDDEPYPPEDGNKEAQAQRRRNILLEILSTEETYVHSLQALVEIYIDGAEKDKIFTPEESRVLFSNVHSILLFHQRHLLPEIRRAVEDHDGKGSCIGGVFKQLSIYLKMYSLYVNDFDNANLEAERLMSIYNGKDSPGLSTVDIMEKMGVGAQSRQRKKIRQYIDACKNHPKHNQLNLQGFLLLPVQRIPRYKLLLFDLLKYTPLDHPDRADLILAHRDIAKRADEINERKRVKEANDKVIEIQSRIKGNNKIPLVEPHRRFIKEGQLYLNRIVSLKYQGGLVSYPSTATVSTALHFPSAMGATPIERSISSNSAIPSQPQGGSKPILSSLEVNTVFTYFLFNDIMIQCRRQGKELELHRILELGTKLKPARLISGKVMRIVDNQTIYYFSGDTEELAGWVQAINSR